MEFTVAAAQENLQTPAQSAHAVFHHAERKPGGNGSIRGIATIRQKLGTGLTGQGMGAANAVTASRNLFEDGSRLVGETGAKIATSTAVQSGQTDQGDPGGDVHLTRHAKPAAPSDACGSLSCDTSKNRT
jgi:hypothetical protein